MGSVASSGENEEFKKSVHFRMRWSTPPMKWVTLGVVIDTMSGDTCYSLLVILLLLNGNVWSRLRRRMGKINAWNVLKVLSSVTRFLPFLRLVFPKKCNLKTSGLSITYYTSVTHCHKLTLCILNSFRIILLLNFFNQWSHRFQFYNCPPLQMLLAKSDFDTSITAIISIEFFSQQKTQL